MEDGKKLKGEFPGPTMRDRQQHIDSFLVCLTGNLYLGESDTFFEKDKDSF